MQRGQQQHQKKTEKKKQNIRKMKKTEQNCVLNE